MIAFEVDRRGLWSLTPAYGICHAEGSNLTRSHQLSLNGKTDGFTRADLSALSDHARLPQGRARRILDQNLPAFYTWLSLAQDL